MISSKTTPYTPAEAKALLATPANRLAGQAIALIRANGSPADLSELLRSGASDCFIRRDPAHPRSRLLCDRLLDTCFDDPGKPLVPVVEEHAGYQVQVVTLGDGGKMADVPHWGRRLELFRLCLAHGCQPGSNSWRGGLFGHIMSSCFGRNKDKAVAVAFTKALIEAKRVDPLAWAQDSYAWHGTIEGLETLESLGVSRTAPGLLENCLRYLGCSPNSGETHETHLAVVIALLDAGAKISPKCALSALFSGDSTLTFGRDHLRKAKLFPRILAAVDESLVAPGEPNPLRDGDYVITRLAAVAARDALIDAIHQDGFPVERREEIWRPIRAIDAAVKTGDLAHIRQVTASATDFLACHA